MAARDIEVRSAGGSGVAGKLGHIGWQAIRLPLLAFLKIVEPIARFILSAVALLGVLLAFFFKFSDAAPRFPFWLVFGLSLGCGALVVVLNAVMRRLAR